VSSAIILAAGKSTRMKSDVNKHLHIVHNKTILEHIVETVSKIADERIVVVVGHQKERIIESLGKFKRVIFVHQTEQLGTGHAVLVCKDTFAHMKGAVFIIPGDTPFIKPETLRRMQKIFDETQSLITLLTARVDKPHSYGRIVMHKTGKIKKIVEARDATRQELTINHINAAIYLADVHFLFEALAKVSNLNDQKEYYLTDIVEQASRMEKVSYLEVDENEIVGINTMEDLERARNL